MTDTNNELLIKNEPFLGKSSLSIQFVEGQFVDSYDPTIENSKLEFFFRLKNDAEILALCAIGGDFVTFYLFIPERY